MGDTGNKRVPALSVCLVGTNSHRSAVRMSRGPLCQQVTGSMSASVCLSSKLHYSSSHCAVHCPAAAKSNSLCTLSHHRDRVQFSVLMPIRQMFPLTCCVLNVGLLFIYTDLGQHA